MLSTLMLAIALAPASGGKAAADAVLAGHYVLSGMSGANSELSLQADGHFELRMHSDDMDKAAIGHWAREGNAVVLTIEPPPRDKPLFSLSRIAAWDAAAEERLLNGRREVAEREVHMRCPFFTGDLPPAPRPQHHGPASKSEAAAKLAQALAARAKVEAIAQRTMATPVGDLSDQALNKIIADAESARSAWSRAREAAYQAASDAGLPRPEIADPKLPAACTLPPLAKPSAPQTWIGGKGLALVDGKGAGVKGVSAAMQFKDGHSATIVTRDDGFAYLPADREPGEIRALTLRIGARDQRIEFTPFAKGIAEVTADGTLLARLAWPPIESLRLLVDGKDLVTPEDASARFKRTP